MKIGEADCIFTIFRTAEREEFLDFGNQSVIPQIVYFYAKKEGGDAYFNGNFDEIEKLRIGTAFKVNYGPKFEEARARLHIDEAPTIEQTFKKLAVGRVDLVPSNLYTATAMLAKSSFTEFADKIVKLPIPIDNVPSYVAFSKLKRLTALCDQFDSALKKFIASNEYQRLLEKYRIENTPELTKFLQSR